MKKALSIFGGIVAAASIFTIIVVIPKKIKLSFSIEPDEYIRDSVGKTFFSAYNDDKPIGFLYLKQTGKDTAELAVMGVLKEFHPIKREVPFLRKLQD